MNSFPSKIFEQTVNEFATLPGIGRRSAVRMALFMLRQSPDDARRFGETMIRLINEIRFCKNCHNLADADLCSICNDRRRDQSLVCVVEDVRDLLAVENTNQYHGLYHVLGGIISPMDGIGPSNLNIDSLLSKVTGDGGRVTGEANEAANVAWQISSDEPTHLSPPKESGVLRTATRHPSPVKEIIMALSPTMEGDTTVFYIYKKLNQLGRGDLNLSTIARGIAIGDDIEYADEVTLGRSILNRMPYESSFVK